MLKKGGKRNTLTKPKKSRLLVQTSILLSCLVSLSIRGGVDKSQQKEPLSYILDLDPFVFPSLCENTVKFFSGEVPFIVRIELHP